MRIIEYIIELFKTPLGQLNILQIALVAGVCICLFFVGKFAIKFLSTIGRFFKTLFSSKQKCKKIQCHVCGRTLDRCVCQKNKDKSYFSRLYNYRKEQRVKKDS